MSIKQLVDFIDEDNIAAIILERDDGAEQLKKIAEKVVEWYAEDWDSMDDWVSYAEKGVELLKPELHGKSTPWENAANFKSPLLMEASLDFANRASLEVLRPKNLVKADVIGKDEDGAKLEQANRVSTFQNYQINHQIKGWRKKQKKLFYSLPSFGTVFKKSVYDPLLGRPTSHLIQYPNFAVGQGAESLEEARSFTQVLAFSRNDVIERVTAGMWIDQDIYAEATEGENQSDTGSNEEQDTDDAVDNDERFFEQRCNWDLDDDGYAEPYIITVHEKSNSVVRIVPRFDVKSIVVEFNKEIMPLLEAVEAQTNVQKDRDEDIPEDTDYSDFDLVRIDPIQDIVQYGLIPSFDGTLLDLGYFHLLGAITMGVNTTTNQLLDAGTLANRQSGLLAKGFRKKMGPIPIKPGQFVSTNIEASQLQNGIMVLPIKEPSPTLFQLNEKLEATGRGLAASTDLSGQLTAQTAPTTALALIHESLISLSALMDNIIGAMSEEYQILFRINQRTLTQKIYETVLDDEEANFQKDFNSDLMDIVSTANSEMSSKAQRLQTAEAFMSQYERIVQGGGSGSAVIKMWVEAINSDVVDQILPEQSNLSPEDKKLIEQQTQVQQQANDIQAVQLENQKLQTQILQRDLERVESKTKAEVEGIAADTAKTRLETLQSVDLAQKELQKLSADIILTLERAESEDVKNNINVYTARIAGIQQIFDSLGVINNAAGTNRADQREPFTQSTITGRP